MGGTSTSRKQALTNTVRQLAMAPSVSYFGLAVKLAELHDVDPEALRSLPDGSLLSRRRMYYLLEAGALIRAHDISEAVAEHVGWTKLKIVAQHVLRDSEDPASVDIKPLLSLANEHKAKDLAAALKGKRVPDKRVAEFYLSTDERAFLRKALLTHGAKEVGRGLVGKEEALMNILRSAKSDLPA